MSKPVVFVIGASGIVGSATLTSLSANYADKVEIRAGVRNLEKAEKLKAIPNVTIVQATMGDSNLVSVFTGVSTLYIVSPGTVNRAELTISTAEYANQAGVKHIVAITGSVSTLTDTIIGAQLADIESKISKLGLPHTFLHLPMFMENYLTLKDSIVQGTIYGAYNPDTPSLYATVEDIGKASAAILVHPEKYANKSVAVVGDYHSYNDFVKAFSEVLGREIKYQQVPYEACKEEMMAKGFPEIQAEGLIEVFKLINASHPAVTDTHPGVFKNLTGEEPMNMKQWLAKNAEEFK